MKGGAIMIGATKPSLVILALLIVGGCATAKIDVFPPTTQPRLDNRAGASVVTYPAPSGGIPLSSEFTVTAAGQNVDVYQVKVPPRNIGYTPCPSSYEKGSMAYFDFSGTVKIQITSSQTVSSVVVRPLRQGIQPSVNRNTISFSLSQPANVSVEINGDDRHNLHLFANPMETAAPSPSDPNVVYFMPGVHGDGSTMILGNDKPVYVAGGAVVYGVIYTSTIRGRGIISGEKTAKECRSGGGSSLIISSDSPVDLEGFIALDPPEWLFQIMASTYVTIDNVKGIAWRGNGDGIELINVEGATVKNVFIRATDQFEQFGDAGFCSMVGRCRPCDSFPASGRQHQCPVEQH